MEKIMIIVIELCAIGLAIQMFWHYFTDNNDSLLIIMGVIFSIFAIWAHIMQKNTKLFKKDQTMYRVYDSYGGFVKGFRTYSEAFSFIRYCGRYDWTID